MLGGIAVVAIGFGYFWLTGGRYVSTADAYVRAAKLMVSTDVSGIVSAVDVKEVQTVKAGDILFRIDPLQFQDRARDREGEPCRDRVEPGGCEGRLSAHAERHRLPAGGRAQRPGRPSTVTAPW